MKKKVIALTSAIIMSVSIGYAAPFTDYSSGKIAIDVTRYNIDSHITNNWGYDETPGVKNTEFGITVGLGNDWAVQYNQFSPKTGTFGIDNETIKVKMRDYNVLHKLSADTNVFIGVKQVRMHDTYIGVDANNDRNIFQVGLTASKPICDKTILFSTVAVGKDMHNLEIGLAYQISSNIDANIIYRNTKVNDIQSSVDNRVIVNSSFKGVGYGLTLKL